MPTTYEGVYTHNGRKRRDRPIRDRYGVKVDVSLASPCAKRTRHLFSSLLLQHCLCHGLLWFVVPYTTSQDFPLLHVVDVKDTEGRGADLTAVSDVFRSERGQE